MPTTSTAQLDRFAREWAALPDYPSSQLSGIVGDRAHEERGGYHIGRQFQPATNYSVVRPEDRPGNGPSDKAAAVDMTMSTPDMIKCHKRLRAAFLAEDPRMRYINAWNGWDGQGDAGRYDVYSGAVSTATPDHKWHIHLEIRRRYVNDAAAMDAILSVLRGEALEDDQEDQMDIAEFFASIGRACNPNIAESAEDRQNRDNFAAAARFALGLNQPYTNATLPANALNRIADNTEAAE